MGKRLEVAQGWGDEMDGRGQAVDLQGQMGVQGLRRKVIRCWVPRIMLLQPVA